jgi:hypothetical protein
MNIFVLDYDKKLAAKYHCDKHIVKMTTETAQMVSFTHRIINDNHLPEFIMNISKSQVSHPCTKWARESYENFIWLCEFGMELYNEYQNRYNKPDKHQRSKNIFQWSLKNPPNLPKKGLTKFPLAMPDDVKTNDVVESYRNFYIKYKKDFAEWKHSEKPKWFK